MRLPADHFPRPQPSALLTLGALRQAQGRLAALAMPVVAATDVPLARAAGRVLAADLQAAPDLGDPVLARGTRLAARHLPLLVGAGRATASVLARVRVGVIALQDDDAGPGAAGAATWIAATLERLGAQSFEAGCRASDPKRLLETLEMFANGCELVLVTGFLGPRQCAAVSEAQRQRKLPDAVETWRLRPFGALQVMKSGTTRVVALSADLASAVVAFTTLVSPLVRRLQGRHDALPEASAAELDSGPSRDADHWCVFPAHVDPGALDSRLVLKPGPGLPAAQALAQADGLAWQAADFATFERNAVAYFPFDTWTA